MDTKVINGNVHANYGPVYGCLAGWSNEDGCCTIDMITIEGYLKFESLKSESEEAVKMAENILNGNSGLQNPNRFIEIKNGFIVIGF